MKNEELEGIPSQEKVAVEKPKFALTPKAKKIILAAGTTIFLLLLVSAVIIGLKTPKQTKRNIPIVTPPYFVVTATPPPQPTKWASDAGVLKIKSDLASVSGELNTVDLNEPMLLLPNIDLRVTFQ